MGRSSDEERAGEDNAEEQVGAEVFSGVGDELGHGEGLG